MLHKRTRLTFLFVVLAHICCEDVNGEFQALVKVNFCLKRVVCGTAWYTCSCATAGEVFSVLIL